MVRTQIQLSEEQLAALKEIALREGRSVADLVRAGVDAWLRTAGAVSREEQKRRALLASGCFRSKHKTLARRHDEHLAKAFR